MVSSYLPNRNPMRQPQIDLIAPGEELVTRNPRFVLSMKMVERFPYETELMLNFSSHRALTQSIEQLHFQKKLTIRICFRC